MYELVRLHSNAAFALQSRYSCIYFANADQE